MPKACYLIFIFTLLTCGLYAQPISVKADCEALNQLSANVNKGTLNRRNAAARFQTLIKRIKLNCHLQSISLWAFPLAGYTYRAIGGINGSGYSALGYNYFDGNRHAAHPAHDIFINDSDQNNLDDRTHKPVNVLAVTDGIVIACTDHWQAGSIMRGGKYIWLYHPSLNLLTYYAHNQHILVEPGTIVKRGQKIAEAGRTGFNAYKKRSPTHLHFSAFRLVQSLPIPYNPYITLTKAMSL